MNKKQLKQEIRELKQAVIDGAISWRALLAEHEQLHDKFNALEQEKLNHTWAERVLPRAIETLSLANAQHAEREAALIAEIAMLEGERMTHIRAIEELRTRLAKYEPVEELLRV